MEASIMAVLRDSERKNNRLTTQHLNARDRALEKMHEASMVLGALVEIERGETSEPALSPRYDPVEKLRRELDSLTKQLDEVYV